VETGGLEAQDDADISARNRADQREDDDDGDGGEGEQQEESHFPGQSRGGVLLIARCVSV
jgi:hypothetical protein